MRDLIEKLQADLARVRVERDQLAKKFAEADADRVRLASRVEDAEETFRHLLARLAQGHRERQSLVAELKRTYGGPKRGGKGGRRTPGDPTFVDLLLEWLGAL